MNAAWSLSRNTASAATSSGGAEARAAECAPSDVLAGQRLGRREHVGVDRPGTDAVHADALAAVLDGERAREATRGRLWSPRRRDCPRDGRAAATELTLRITPPRCAHHDGQDGARAERAAPAGSSRIVAAMLRRPRRRAAPGGLMPALFTSRRCRRRARRTRRTPRATGCRIARRRTAGAPSSRPSRSPATSRAPSPSGDS